MNALDALLKSSLRQEGRDNGAIFRRPLQTAPE